MKKADDIMQYIHIEWTRFIVQQFAAIFRPGEFNEPKTVMHEKEYGNSTEDK